MDLKKFIMERLERMISVKILENVKVKDMIYYGSYPQNRGIKTPIEWIVLEKQKDKILVLSKLILESRKYHE